MGIYVSTFSLSIPKEESFPILSSLFSRAYYYSLQSSKENWAKFWDLFLKYLWKQRCPQGIYLDLFYLFWKSSLWATKRSAFFPPPFSPLQIGIWKSSLERTIEHIDDQFARRMRAVMCVPWFLLLELSDVPVCDSPQTFEKSIETKIVPMITTGQGWNVPCGLLSELDHSPVVTQLQN